MPSSAQPERAAEITTANSSAVPEPMRRSIALAAAQDLADRWLAYAELITMIKAALGMPPS